MLGRAGLVCEMGLASRGRRKPVLVLNLFQCIVIFSERSCGPSFVVSVFITQHNICCIGVRDSERCVGLVKKSDLVQLDHLEGNPAKEQVRQPAFLRQLLSYVVFLSFCLSVCFVLMFISINVFCV